MTESEHGSLMEKVKSTEVRKGSQHVVVPMNAALETSNIYL